MRRRRERPFIPRVEDFTVGRFMLRDERNLPRPDFKATRGSYEDYLEAKLKRIRPATTICANEPTPLDRRVQRIKDSGMTIEDFDEANPKYTAEDWEHDPELGFLAFGVYTRNKVRGLFTLYNVSRRRVTQSEVIVSAMACPAFTTGKGDLPSDDVGDIMAHMLETDLPLENGKVLDLRTWFFPTERHEHVWCNYDDRERFHPAVTFMLNRGHLATVRNTHHSGVVIRSVRRKS